MNIALIPNMYLPKLGGVELTVYNLARKLKDEGHEINVITQSGSFSESYQSKDGIDVYELLFPPDICFLPKLYFSHIVAFFRNIWMIPYSVYKILRLLRKKHIEILHIHNVTFFSLSVLLASYFYKVKFIVTLHGSYSSLSTLYPNSGIRAIWLFRMILKRADYIVACSYNVLSKAQKIMPSIEKKSKVIYGGVNIDRFCCKEKYLHTRPYILAISNFYYYKGGDILVMAFKSIAERFSNTNLLFAGEGCGKERCKNLAKLLGLKNKVFFLGKVMRKEVIKLFNGCEFFVLPSVYEPFGIVNLEAMAAGKAILASNSGGIPEVVRDGINGILVDPKNDSALARGMIRLLEDKELRNKLGRNGKDMIKRYSWEKTACTYLDIYDQVHNRDKIEDG